MFEKIGKSRYTVVIHSDKAKRIKIQIGEMGKNNDRFTGLTR